jgi:GNAT superfamily N-acetyltransferase
MHFNEINGDPIVYCRVAQRDDLAAINQIITDAVMVWPMVERAKRLILPVLCYSENDFDYYKILLWIDNQQIVGVAIWDAKRPIETVKGYAKLLHGLYVAPSSQGQGIGRALMAEVKARVTASDACLDGLLVKAERVSISFFEHCGLERMTILSMEEYPYQFWQPLQA